MGLKTCCSCTLFLRTPNINFGKQATLRNKGLNSGKATCSSEHVYLSSFSTRRCAAAKHPAPERIEEFRCVCSSVRPWCFCGALLRRPITTSPPGHDKSVSLSRASTMARCLAWAFLAADLLEECPNLQFAKFSRALVFLVIFDSSMFSYLFDYICFLWDLPTKTSAPFRRI